MLNQRPNKDLVTIWSVNANACYKVTLPEGSPAHRDYFPEIKRKPWVGEARGAVTELVVVKVMNLQGYPPSQGKGNCSEICQYEFLGKRNGEGEAKSCQAMHLKTEQCARRRKHKRLKIN